MKIQCDECGKEAYVFCTADEAALCKSCDNRVHDANKLARKHPRFSLQHPRLKECPSCDICQVMNHIRKHNRFLLTGVKISPVPDSEHQVLTSSIKFKSEIDIKNSITMETNFQSNSISTSSEQMSNFYGHDDESSQLFGQHGSASTSSISEYLMETLPGWHVEDLLDP